jgi:uncharacterized protein YndB with AHSA1/START domain
MKVSAATGLRLRLERNVAARREQVWEAWTTPSVLERWSAPAGMTIPGGAMDLRVGGRWEVTMEESGTGRKHVAFGRYLEITPPARLVYTHAWRQDSGGSSPETTVTVEFIEEGGATRVVLTQEGFENVGIRDGHGEGWSSSLDRLVELMEGA